MEQGLRKHYKYLGLGLVFLVTVLLRIPNLGYSDYIGDEHKAFLEPVEGQSKIEFLLSKRKGPMQFIISEIPHIFTGDFKNELAQRIPFSLFGVFSVIIFYELVTKLTKSVGVGVISALLLSTNGFIVGFSRIAQYQNLNLFFSFASLYFYSDLLVKEKIFIRSSLLGTLMFSFSLLSHWDVIFILPPASYIFVQFVKNKNYEKRYKVNLILLNFFLGSIILLPFLLPYVVYQINSLDNLRYFSRRIELGQISFERYKLLIDLYNPYLTFWFYVIAGIVGAFFMKRSYVYLLWFIINYSIFELFVRKPGTHIYNFLIPVFILSGIGIVEVIKRTPKSIRIIPCIEVSVFLSMFIYQSYVLFIDHKVEYPWSQENIYGHETKLYTEDDKLPLFGFPHRRYWKEINEFVNSQNNDYHYVSNEVKTISEYYMDKEYGSDDGSYVIGVKRPLSFSNDWGMTNIGRKTKVKEIRNDYGKTVVKIYRVDPKE